VTAPQLALGGAVVDGSGQEIQAQLPSEATSIRDLSYWHQSS